ncbi:MAG: sulfur transferase domain-containing protein [Planctomycetota bacterium]|nr:sulfur transferase domain-containing protein [Planctomycetota bacterium]
MRLASLALLVVLVSLAACTQAPRQAGGSGGAREAKEAQASDAIVVAGQPTEARIAELGTQGFDLVISLNPAKKGPSFDEANVVAAAGLAYENAPVTKETVKDAAVRERVYALLEAAEAEGKRTYFHCSSGNRCAAMWALYQAERKGVPPEEALAAGKAVGLTKLEPKVREILGL